MRTGLARSSSQPTSYRRCTNLDILPQALQCSTEDTLVPRKKKYGHVHCAPCLPYVLVRSISNSSPTKMRKLKFSTSIKKCPSTVVSNRALTPGCQGSNSVVLDLRVDVSSTMQYSTGLTALEKLGDRPLVPTADV